MKAIITFPEYVAEVSGYSHSDIAGFHKDTEQWLALAPYHDRIRHSCGVYVISYLTNEYLYLNEGFAHIVGVPIKRLYDAGCRNREEKLYPPDMSALREHVITNNMAFFSAIPRECHAEYAMQSTYRIHAKDGGLRTILQESYFIQSTHDRKPLTAIGFITDISELKHDPAIVWSIRHSNGAVLRSERYLPYVHLPEFTTRQNEILRLLCERMSIKQIAQQLHRSVRTIGNIQQDIFKRANCHTISELLHYARLRGVW